MISFGKNIRLPNDPLVKIPLKQFADKIKNPGKEFVDFITQLRELQSIDPKQYREWKVKLPYAVAAIFYPPFRKKENFAKTDYFILDIDHLSDKEINIEHLMGRLETDERIALAFRSPSNDGVKLFFKLKQSLFDAGKYALFYKIFARKFAAQYDLHQVVDKKTSDVSRACFLSYDPRVLYRAEVVPVEVERYINFENETEVSLFEKEIKEQEKIRPETHPADADENTIPQDVIQKIREKLNPRLTVKKEKNIFVPEELNLIVEPVKKSLAQYDIVVDEIVNINYGKQFRMKLQHMRAEINVFYGKKGYSVIKSTKSGLNDELVDLTHQIISSAIL